MYSGERFTLRDAIGLYGPEMTGAKLWDSYKRWPVYSKFFDNLGPIPHHMHQNQEQAAKLGREGKPESDYFPPPAQLDGEQFSLHLLRTRAGDEEGRRPPLPGTVEPGRQRNSRSLQGLPAQARYRLAGSPGRAPRPRLAGHL